MNKRAIWVFIAMLAMAWQASATIRYVSAQGAGQYTTFDAAFSAAVSGDTILVGPGTYNFTGALSHNNKRLTWIGAGWDQTIVNLGSNYVYIIGTGSNRTSFEGFSLLGTSYTFIGTTNVDSCAIRRCYIVTSAYGVEFGGGQLGRGLTLEDCILVHTGNSASYHCLSVSSSNYVTTIRNCVFVNQGGSTTTPAISGAAGSGPVELYNCVFLNWKTAFDLNTAGAPLVAVNNMFYDWLASPTFGTYNASSIFDYNASQASPPAPGTNTLTIASNPFVNYSEALNYQHGVTDLHLHATNGAAFINTGHPSLLDFTDNSRSDFGAYGGPKPLVDNGVPNYPWAVNVVANPTLVGQGTPVNASATGRVGPSY